MSIDIPTFRFAEMPSLDRDVKLQLDRLEAHLETMRRTIQDAFINLPYKVISASSAISANAITVTKSEGGPVVLFQAVTGGGTLATLSGLEERDLALIWADTTAVTMNETGNLKLGQLGLFVLQPSTDPGLFWVDSSGDLNAIGLRNN